MGNKNEIKNILIKVPVSVHYKLTQIAKTQNRSMSGQIKTLLENFVFSYEKQYGPIEEPE